MPDTTHAAGQEVRLAGERDLRIASAVADRPVATLFLVATTAPTAPTEAEARERMRKIAVATRRGLAADFAARVMGSEDVRELWLSADDPELAVTLIVSGVSLDRELQLRAVFAELTRDQPAELEIYETNDVPEYAREGERLLG
jgi:hypothetical protein